VSVYERAILSNGIRVVTAPMPHAHSVTCVVMIGAGSRYETAETRGIAHFAEHMFFKGTEKRPSPREISRVIDSIGGAQNAATNKEYTLYYVRCGAEQRDVALEWLVDILRNSKFDAGDIEREKGVVVEELNMYADTPRDIIDSIYEEHLYGENPLGWEILGTEETVRSADRERFLDYLGRWYTPDRIVVGVAGDVGEGLVETLEELLGDMHGEAAGAPAPATAAPSERPRVRVQHKASEQAHLCLGVLSKPIDHPDRYTLHLLATILGGGSSSRLFTEVREERGLAYYVNAYADSYTDTGTLYAQAGVDLARVDDAVETIARELKRHRRGSRRRRRARARAQFRERPVRPADRDAAGADHVRPPARGAGGRGGRSRGAARGPRRGHRRGPSARRAGDARRAGAQPGADRPVRRSCAVRSAALLATTLPFRV